MPWERRWKGGEVFWGVIGHVLTDCGSKTSERLAKLLMSYGYLVINLVWNLENVEKCCESVL